MSRLQAWYAGLQLREQRMVLVGSISVAVLVLVFGILLPLQTAVSNATQRIDTKREDLEWMQINAAEVSAAGNSLPADTGEAPLVLVDRVGREAGLGSALRGTQPEGNGIRVQLEGASFDTLVGWLAALDERYGVAIDAMTIDRAAKPGEVNASISFAQPRR
ncbi:MAG TPA: type II secretion system protein M [Steroidobacteraceae bacterium]|jgi:general secretion pathway protein M|nr:type II secretion system protein M [Steroidobacteraceae bacterium]